MTNFFCSCVASVHPTRWKTAVKDFESINNINSKLNNWFRVFFYFFNLSVQHLLVISFIFFLLSNLTICQSEGANHKSYCVFLQIIMLANLSGILHAWFVMEYFLFLLFSFMLSIWFESCQDICYKRKYLNPNPNPNHNVRHFSCLKKSGTLCCMRVSFRLLFSVLFVALWVIIRRRTQLLKTEIIQLFSESDGTFCEVMTLMAFTSEDGVQTYETMTTTARTAMCNTQHISWMGLSPFLW